ncbi:MAG: hypothetical protein PWP51_1526 [Clostridiales bacterium]|nr:hypothetical protein [Clostridiales bacterium]MDN5298973.1 hypothetical protein [Clostridiales bacterium]
MSYQQAFKTQWETFYTMMEAAVIRQIKSGTPVTAAYLNECYRAEIAPWFDQRQHQGIWLSKMLSEDPEKGSAFEQMLKTFRFDDVAKVKAPSFAPYVVIALLSGVLGNIVGRLIHLATWQIWAATVLIPILLGSAFLSLWRSKQVAVKLQGKAAYLTALTTLENDLEKICVSLDER